MKIIIVGCGRMGRDVSLTLIRDGHQVTVIDSDPDAFKLLGTQFPGNTIAGIGFDRDVLLKAGIERADGLAAVTSSDNANIVTAQVASRMYRIPRVVARLDEPRRAEVFRKLGIQTIPPWHVSQIIELLTQPGPEIGYKLGSGDVLLVEIEIGPAQAGRTVQQISEPAAITVIAITRDGLTFMPDAQTPLLAGDRVHLAAQRSTESRLAALRDGR
ncbi:MAG: TrkA family potassium uptake protein [Anaerolineae bacterium]|nr:TrkA family potassium uptake protein [Anaerolineae bacterium]